MGYFYRLRVKRSNHLHTELSLVYPKDRKFYLESKASFFDIGSITSFRLFLIAWLREYCPFSDSPVVSLKSWPWSKYIQLGTIPSPPPPPRPQKIMFDYQTFFSSSNMFFIRLFLANIREKIEGHRARLREKENLFRYRAI